ncbi:MAG: hypothetical protein ACYCWE_11050 [Eubacteriales bacterium]
MKSKLRRNVSLLLAFIMLIGFSACGKPTEEEQTNEETLIDSPQTVSEEPDLLEARKLVGDNLPEADFNGSPYTVLTYNDTRIIYFVAEEAENGDIVNDALYTRNRIAEERYNVELVFDATRDYLGVVSYGAKCIQAGENAFDLFCSHVVSLSELSLKGMMMNWYDIDSIDFDKPWWSSSNIKDLTYKNVSLLAVGDFAMSALSYTYCMYFDKNLVEDYAIGDLYETVLNGVWTIDEMNSLTKDIYSDLNSDSKADEEDFYGLSFRVGSHTNAFLWSFNNPIMVKDKDGVPQNIIKTEKINDILVRLNSIANDNAGTIAITDYTKALDIFVQGRAVFCLGDIGNALSNFRENEHDYGIIPYPKWDEIQTAYYTCVNGAHEAMAVPVTVTDIEKVGIITELLCAETYKQVVPAYYDTALKVKGTRDEVSVEILDMIVGSRVFDFGFIYDNWKGASFLLQDLVLKNNSDFQSLYESKESSINTYYESVIAAMEDYIK